MTTQEIEATKQRLLKEWEASEAETKRRLIAIARRTRRTISDVIITQSAKAAAEGTPTLADMRQPASMDERDEFYYRERILKSAHPEHAEHIDETARDTGADRGSVLIGLIAIALLAGAYDTADEINGSTEARTRSAAITWRDLIANDAKERAEKKTETEKRTEEPKSAPANAAPAPATPAETPAAPTPPAKAEDHLDRLLRESPVKGVKNVTTYESVEKTADKLTAKAEEIIKRGYAQGRPYREIAKEVADICEDVELKDAYRLVYTTGTYMFNESQAMEFEEAGFEEYDFVTAGDNKVCNECLDIEGAGPYKFAERETGVNFPPIHPWCRCTHTVVIPRGYLGVDTGPDEEREAWRRSR